MGTNRYFRMGGPPRCFEGLHGESSIPSKISAPWEIFKILIFLHFRVNAKLCHVVVLWWKPIWRCMLGLQRCIMWRLQAGSKCITGRSTCYHELLFIKITVTPNDSLYHVRILFSCYSYSIINIYVSNILYSSNTTEKAKLNWVTYSWILPKVCR